MALQRNLGKPPKGGGAELLERSKGAFVSLVVDELTRTGGLKDLTDLEGITGWLKREMRNAFGPPDLATAMESIAPDFVPPPMYGLTGHQLKALAVRVRELTGKIHARHNGTLKPAHFASEVARRCGEEIFRAIVAPCRQ